MIEQGLCFEWVINANVGSMIEMSASHFQGKTSILGIARSGSACGPLGRPASRAALFSLAGAARIAYDSGPIWPGKSEMGHKRKNSRRANHVRFDTVNGHVSNTVEGPLCAKRTFQHPR